MGISGFLSSGNRGVRTPLELRWGTSVSSRVAAGESGLLLSCSRNGVSSRVATEDSELLSKYSEKSMFLWICNTGYRIPLESWHGSWGSPPAWLVLRVPGDLQWGILLSSLGGGSSLAGMFRMARVLWQ